MIFCSRVSELPLPRDFYFFYTWLFTISRNEDKLGIRYLHNKTTKANRSNKMSL
jgi:hypothetical protein